MAGRSSFQPGRHATERRLLFHVSPVDGGQRKRDLRAIPDGKKHLSYSCRDTELEDSAALRHKKGVVSMEYAPTARRAEEVETPSHDTASEIPGESSDTLTLYLREVRRTEL